MITKEGRKKVDTKTELGYIKLTLSGIKDRVNELEKGLEEEPELSYQAELDALIEDYSFYKIIEATCGRVELRYMGTATGPYAIELTAGGGFRVRPDNSHNSAFLVLEELHLLTALADALSECEDC